jgi:hypothetical protein
MPYSNTLFDELAKQVIICISPGTCIDIGAGAGKYGRIMRECAPRARTVAVEIDQDYITTYQLRDLYHEVQCIDAITLVETGIDDQHDLVILSHVLEHMPKSKGIDLIEFLVYRCKYLVIAFPLAEIQNSYNGHIHEAHISIWSPRDFIGKKHLWARNAREHFIVVEGYLADPRTFSHLRDLRLWQAITEEHF